MARHHEFEVMIATRIEIAREKTNAMVAAAPLETDVERRRVLEACGLAIDEAARNLGELKAADSLRWSSVQRDLNEVWRKMEIAVRMVTGEPSVTLVTAPTVPTVRPGAELN